MILEVGKQFKEGVTRYQEGCKVDITAAGIDFMVYYSAPTQEEIKDIKKGPFKFGFYDEKNVILMLFRFGNQAWMNSPYSVHLSKNLTELKEPTEGIGYALNVYLIDADTGILKSMRLIGLNTKISKMLYKAIAEQKQQDYAGFETNLNNIYAKYPTKVLVSIGKIM
jgi:hypothetical protein